MGTGMMTGWINERQMILCPCSSRKHMLEPVGTNINTTLAHYIQLYNCIFHNNHDAVNILSKHNFIRQSHGEVSRDKFPDTLYMELELSRDL
jgi:hypothetical protein